MRGKIKHSILGIIITIIIAFITFLRFVILGGGEGKVYSGKEFSKESIRNYLLLVLILVCVAFFVAFMVSWLHLKNL